MFKCNKYSVISALTGEPHFHKDRLTYTFFSNQTHRQRINLYLELGRECNANCSFCRNKTFDPCEYDFEAIRTNAIYIGRYVNTIIVGGGEPTTKMDDLMTLINDYERDIIASKRLQVITNGKFELNKLKKLIYNSDIYISRHALDDEENAAIFGSKPDKIIRANQYYNKLSYYDRKRITFSATCGPDTLCSPEKIEEYVKGVSDLGINKMLLCNLMKDASSSIIEQPEDVFNDEAFDEIFSRLKSLGYKEGKTIVSTGGYFLTIFKQNYGGSVVVLKRYITKKELAKTFPYAEYQTYDLSMNPQGEIFQSWHQENEPVKVERFDSYRAQQKEQKKHILRI